MSRATIFTTRLQALGICLLLLLDCLLSIAISVLLLPWAVATRQEGAAPSPYETMSARAGRGILNRKLVAVACAWAIDRTFALWQPPRATLPDGRVFSHPSHCVRAFIKTRHLAYLPAEYSRPLPPSLLACYANKAP